MGNGSAYVFNRFLSVIIRVDSDYPNYLLINVMNDFHVTLKKKSKSKIQLLNDWLQKESMVQEVSLFLAA